MTFANEDLRRLDIARETIAPFISRPEDRKKLLGESTGHSSLEKRPLVDFGDARIPALPQAASPAIRRFVLSELRQMGYLEAFGNALAISQAHQVEEDALWELLSIILISQLLMLARDMDHPIKRSLKCIKQKEWAEGEGIHFQNLNGDFNYYCYWPRNNYQLVPQELPVDSGSMIWIGNDFVLAVRQEVRNLVDRHLARTAKGSRLCKVRCGGPLKIVSLIDSAAIIPKILRPFRLWDRPERPTLPAPERSLYYDTEVAAFNGVGQLSDASP